MSARKPTKKAKAAAAKAAAKAAAERDRIYQTSEHYKRHRKLRYLHDENYRERCLANARVQAERKIAEEAAQYRSDVSKNLTTEALERIGSQRFVKGKPRNTFSIIELSNLILRPAAAVRNWINSERFPRPEHAITKASGFYTESQAVAIAHAMMDHMKTRNSHLLSSRTKAISALHRAMKAR